MIIEKIFDDMTYAERIYVSKFFHRFLDMFDMRYLKKRSYFDE